MLDNINKRSASKSTKQSKAIRQVFVTANRPLSPNEVLNLAEKESPNLGIATVYRNIRKMIKNAELQVREIPGQTARYCLPGSEKSSLFICTLTHQVFYLDDKHIKLSVKNLPGEFQVDNYEIFFYGSYQGPDVGLI